MDPSSLPTPCFERLMDFFKAKEILQLTTVSSKWHHAITSSSLVMSRFELAVRGDWILDYEMPRLEQLAAESDRAYSRLLLSSCDAIMPQILEVMAHPARRWKNIQLYSIKFSSAEEINEFFSYIEETIKKLTLYQVAIQGNTMLKFNQMKKLESLKICFIDSIIYKRILESAPNLQKLELGIVKCMTETAIEAIKKLEHLKVLRLSKEWLKLLLEKNPDDIKFRLTELDLIMPRSYDEVNKENFIKFLDAQKDMKKMTLIEWFDFEILDKIFSMKLKELSMWDVPEYGWTTNHVMTNKTIEVIDMKMVYIEPHQNNIQEFLKRLPNVKHLMLRQINDEIANYIALTMPKIEIISLIHDNYSESLRQILPKVEFN